MPRPASAARALEGGRGPVRVENLPGGLGRQGLRPGPMRTVSTSQWRPIGRWNARIFHRAPAVR